MDCTHTNTVTLLPTGKRACTACAEAFYRGLLAFNRLRIEQAELKHAA